MCVANWWALWGVWADFEKEIRYTDIINIKWLLAISEYSEKKSLEEHQKKLDFLKQCCEACEPCIQSIRENFVILHLVIIISIGTYWVRWVAFS